MHSLVFFAFLAWPLSVPAQRSHIHFDEGWKFHFGHAADPAKDFNYGIAAVFSKTGNGGRTAIDPGFNDSGWRLLDLPHDWAVELPFAPSGNADVMAHGYKPVGGLFPATSIGWYRKHFSVPLSDTGRHIQLQFDGVFRNAAFWINGIYLGTNFSGYLGTAYDVTDMLRFGSGSDNVVVVRVDATQYEGWFYEGAGIYRHVWLNEYAPVHIATDGLFVSTDGAATNATVSVETTVENEDSLTAGCTVLSYLADRSGHQVGTAAMQELVLPVPGNAVAHQKLSIAHPHLWSPDDPYLYRLVCLLRRNGTTIDSMIQRIGIRSIGITAQGVWLNGQHIKIKGTNNHQDHAGLGSALPDYLQYYRIQLLKELGANAYRTSHHAPAPELLDACDSLGMLVLDEQRQLNSGPEYLGQFERLLKRDRSRTCVFLWSIGNEEGWIHTTNTGRRIAQTLLLRQRALDPTRTSTYAADVGNIFMGVNKVIPVRGFNYREFAVADYHRDHPQQPLIGTEMGSTVTTRGIYEKDSVRAYVPDQDITAPWWASTAEAWWKLAAPNDYWLGGFVWTGFDYRGEPTPFEWPNISSHFGIMDACGFPKNIYYYYQSWWSDRDVLHLSPHWNWKGKEGRPIDVWVNTNASEAELFLNGKSLGKKKMEPNGHLRWQVSYAPGVLEAVAYKAGRKLSAKMETTDAAFAISVSPSRAVLLADGRDAVVVNISVTDRKGRMVPDAGQLLHFSVSGGARIIGVGNGDPSSHEQDKYAGDTAQRSLFNGRCQVILQCGRQAGAIRFEASGEGLKSAAAALTAVPAR